MSNSPVSVNMRRAKISDLHGIVQVVENVFSQEFDFGAGFDSVECRILFENALKDKNEFVVVAECEHRVIGFIHYVNKPPTNGFIALEMIGVHRDFQGKGIGHKLIVRGDNLVACYFIKDRGVPNLATICLSTGKDNPAGQGLYLKSGYKHVGNIPGLIGEGNEELVMLKKLGNVQYRKNLWNKPRA